MIYGSFPSRRLRRTRSAQWIRDLIQENTVCVKDLIWPVFVVDGNNIRQPVSSMPGVERYSIDVLVEECLKARDQGIRAIALFPVTPDDLKTEDGRESYNPDNLICRAIQVLKKAVPEIGIITDVALDPYTSHGHDGLLSPDGMILNDESVDVLCRQALVQAQAGADIIAPSDMMDGRIGAIRAAFEGVGLCDVMILSYAVKYASSFYGPFRDAVQSGSKLKGDKKTYQMNPANGREALHEAALDVQEGADMLMVKPGLPYLDVITRVKNEFKMPVFAYHVSGEYAMLKAAAQNGWLDYDLCLMEVMSAFKRAGADAVLTYGARDIAALLAK